MFLQYWHDPSLVVRVALRVADVGARARAVPGCAAQEDRRVPPREARGAGRGEATAARRVAHHARRGPSLRGGNHREEREEGVQDRHHQ